MSAAGSSLRSLPRPSAPPCSSLSCASSGASDLPEPRLYPRRTLANRTMTILRVHHVTWYRYRRPVGFGQHRLMFRPRDSYDQRLLQATMRVSPEPSDLFWVHDTFGNCVAVADFTGEADHLGFETDIVLEHTPLQRPHFRADAGARTWPFAYDDDSLPDLAPSINRQFPDDQMTQDWARRFIRRVGPTDT